MIVKIPSPELEKYKELGQITADLVQRAGDMAKPGVSLGEIDRSLASWAREAGAEPNFALVPHYRWASCLSVNDVAVHGIPHDSIKLKEGDLLSVDFGLLRDGLNSDHCWTFAVGQPSPLAAKLLKAGKEAIVNAVKRVKSGATTGDLGEAMEGTAMAAGFNVIHEFIGHGIGKRLHEAPEIPAYGIAGTGSMLETGMVICVECQVVAGQPKLVVDRDGWSARTIDGQLSVMFETMCVVTNDGALVLTNSERQHAR